MFSVKELMEISVNVEENGEKFYRKLSKEAEDNKQKKLFEDLADQETEHAKIFRELGEELKAEQENYVQTDDVYAYLRSYIKCKAFPSLEVVFERVKGIPFDGIIDYAIQIEKDTIHFYNEVLKFVKDEKSKKMIDAIIEQEKKHVLELMELKGNMR